MRKGIKSSAVKRLLGVLVAALFAFAWGPFAHAQARNEKEVQPKPGGWGKLAPLPKTSEEFSYASVNGKIYLFGGLPSRTHGPLGLVQEYDPATDKWTEKKNMPLATHHAAVAAYNGKIYLFGGQAIVTPGGSPQMPIANSWEYDPANDSWKALAPMPSPRTAASAAAVDGKIYVIGGASVQPGHKVVPLGPKVPHESLGTNEAYDPATNTWEERAPMPTARNHAAIGVVDGKIYVIGGQLGSLYIIRASPTNVVEIYDPAKNMWGVVGLRMPIPRSGMGYAVHDGKIYIAGGEIYNHDYIASIRAVNVYDPAKNTWGWLPNMPTERHGVSVAAIGDRLYVIGGHIQGGGTGGEAANCDYNEVYQFPGE